MFPNKVLNKYASGLAGTVIESSSTYLQTYQAVTEEAGCEIGKFAIAGTKEPLIKKVDGTSAVIGIIIRDRLYTNVEMGQKLLQGATVTLALNGVVAIENNSGSEAKILSKVWAKADGTYVFSKDTQSDAVDTGWTVKKGGGENEIIHITR